MSNDMKTKTTSLWITHVKKFAKENNLKYNEALRDPGLKVGYVKVERVKTKSSPKMQMEMNRSSMNIEPTVMVKKTRKKKDAMVEPMVEPQMFIPEPKKKVRVKKPY